MTVLERMERQAVLLNQPRQPRELPLSVREHLAHSGLLRFLGLPEPMNFDAHANFAYSTVATAPSPASSGTSLVVAAGDGAKFPAVPFNATVWPAGAQPLTTNAEIVRVTAGPPGSDTFTIVRAQESSSARAIVVGDQIAATITKKTLTDAETSPTLLGVTAIVNGTTSYTIPTGATRLVIEGIGAGGAGGGTGATSAIQVSAAAGGGGGSFAKKYLFSNLGTHTVAVGAGGTGVSAGTGNNGAVTTFKDTASTTVLSAGGGSGGEGAPAVTAASPTIPASGGAGGASGTGDAAYAGQPGVGAITVDQTNVLPGSGGMAARGGGGGLGARGNVSGVAGGVYGGGGSGTGSGVSQAAKTGGAGANGVLVVEAYG